MHAHVQQHTHIRSSQPSPVTTNTEPYSWLYRPVMYRIGQVKQAAPTATGRAVMIMYKASTGTSPSKGHCHTLVFSSVCHLFTGCVVLLSPKLRLPSAVWTADICIAHEQGTGGSTYRYFLPHNTAGAPAPYAAVPGSKPYLGAHTSCRLCTTTLLRKAAESHCNPGCSMCVPPGLNRYTGANTSCRLLVTTVFGEAAGSRCGPGCRTYSSCGMKRLKPSICT